MTAMDEETRDRGPGVKRAVARKQAAEFSQAGLRFSAYRDKNREWRWTLKASNNRIIADSGESYRRKADCMAAIALVQLGAEFAKVKCAA